jgi:hypothetical protein
MFPRGHIRGRGRGRAASILPRMEPYYRDGDVVIYHADLREMPSP